MISVTSTTDRYILQPTLLHKHRETLDWLSAALLWKRELAFFQKLLDQYAVKYTTVDDKKRVDHFQSLIIYYSGELIDKLTSRLRSHEKKVAEMLETRNETNTIYFKEHEELMNELQALSVQFEQNKEDLYAFIETAMRKP